MWYATVDTSFERLMSQLWRVVNMLNENKAQHPITVLDFDVERPSSVSYFGRILINIPL